MTQIKIKKGKIPTEHFLQDSERGDTTINLSGRSSMKRNRERRVFNRRNKKFLRFLKALFFLFLILGSTMIAIHLQNEEGKVVTELVGKVHADFRVNSEGVAQYVPELEEESWVDRMNEMLIRLGREEDVTERRWMRVGYKHGIKPPVLVCIAKADTTLGKYLKSANNLGNVGNNDRGDTVHYGTPIAGIDAIGRVLNNRYLGYKQSIGSLSVGGGGDAPFYATSPENWNNNVINCLSEIYNEVVNEDFLIRM